MKTRFLACLAFVALLGSAAAQTSGKEPRPREPIEPPVWDRLERFANDTEFLNYVRTIQRLNNVRRRESGAADMAVPAPPPPPPPPAATPAPTVSAFGAAQSQPSAGEASSITNVQTQGVDEGGIVKQVGRFLVILQDGRLFVVDTRPGNQAGLSLAHRANVYRSTSDGTWYDELLVSGNRILVTGYSYRESASEITIFTINDAGALTRETTYYITSNDYYDPENYSTRLVNGNLVIYTPLDVRSINTNARVRWPIVRRWLRDGDHRAETTAGRSLFDADDIYKPIQRSRQPLIHSVSVCPLGELSSGDELDCQTTAFAGLAQREFFVSTNDIYLWTTPGYGDEVRDCAATGANANGNAVNATLYQVPLSGATPRAAYVRGRPPSQLALDASPTEFRALLGWNTSNCNRTAENDLRYFRLPLNSLSTTPREAPARSYARVPSPGTGAYEVRFTETHVTYGGRSGYSNYPPGADQPPQTARVITVPVSRPAGATQIEAPHSVIRIERAGNDIVLTGYRTEDGLSLSVLDLGTRPRITDTQLLQGRFESENRSHAFNSFIGQDGSGLMGLPTVTRVKQAGRWVWRSQASDVSFLSIDAAGQLGDIGALESRPNAQDPSYRCEVSCIDWYGNTRALYIGNRVFGLSATELVEGVVSGGRIGEVRRLNLSAPVGARPRL